MSTYSRFLAAIAPACGAVRKARTTRGIWMPAVVFSFIAAMLAPIAMSVVTMGYGMRMVLRGESSRAPVATQLLITTQPSNKAAGVINSVAAKAYAADGTTLVPSWSGDGTLTVTAGTPSVRTVGDFTVANSEYLSVADASGYMTPTTAGHYMYLAAWVNPDAYADHLTIASKYALSTQLDWSFQIHSNGTPRMLLGSSIAGGATFSVPTGEWTFLEYIWVYGVGGAFRKNRSGSWERISATDAPTNHAAAFEIGSHNGGTKNFEGQMANVFLSINQSSIVTWSAYTDIALSAAGEAASADLYNGGVIPFMEELDASTLALAKSSGYTASGDLAFPLDEASGNRSSQSGNITLTDNNTVASASSGESITYADVAIESGDTAESVDGVLGFVFTIGRPGTGYKVTVADDAEELASAQSNAFNIT